MMRSKEEKQQIKLRRVKDVFIATAKDIIIKDGAENVFTRKIADTSGYSLGTIYNYFKNIDELLWEVRSTMIYDINTHIKSIITVVNNVDEMTALFLEFAKYFINNPNIYQFFYLYKLNPDCRPQIDDGYDIDIGSAFDFLIKDGRMSEDEIQTLSQTIIFSIYGMLTIHFSMNDHMDENKLNAQLENIIRYLLKTEKSKN